MASFCTALRACCYCAVCVCAVLLSLVAESSGLTRAICTTCRGNPFFIKEVCSTLVYRCVTTSWLFCAGSSVTLCAQVTAHAAAALLLLRQAGVIPTLSLHAAVHTLVTACQLLAASAVMLAAVVGSGLLCTCVRVLFALQRER